jgi:hypothetical protein
MFEMAALKIAADGAARRKNSSTSNIAEHRDRRERAGGRTCEQTHPRRRCSGRRLAIRRQLARAAFIPASPAGG